MVPNDLFVLRQRPRSPHTNKHKRPTPNMGVNNLPYSECVKIGRFLRTHEQEHYSKTRSSSPAFAEPNYVKENIRNLTGTVNGKPFLVMANTKESPKNRQSCFLLFIFVYSFVYCDNPCDSRHRLEKSVRAFAAGHINLLEGTNG